MAGKVCLEASGTNFKGQCWAQGKFGTLKPNWSISGSNPSVWWTKIKAVSAVVNPLRIHSFGKQVFFAQNCSANINRDFCSISSKNCQGAGFISPANPGKCFVQGSGCVCPWWNSLMTSKSRQQLDARTKTVHVLTHHCCCPNLTSPHYPVRFGNGKTGS